MESSTVPLAIGINIIIFVPSSLELNEVERFVHNQLIEAFKYQNVMISHVEARSSDSSNEGNTVTES